MIKPIACISLAVLTIGCSTGTPGGVQPITGFELERYLGTWYEIARLDHSFEQGLENVSATYSMRADGGVRVLNRGRVTATGDWKQAEGKAYFVNEPDKGHLKVAFFGPFYGSYIIFEIDHADYQHAFVCGHNTSYLWFLARSPTVDPSLIEHFIKQSSELGFDTDELIFPKQLPP